jgi:8-oxo-dGTP pyrophosphatase MutT (NUDIX family)
MAIKKSAIIPYRLRDKELEILLVTKSTSNEWVIPKGKIEAPLKPHISAAKEAFEEAGVLGRAHPIRVGSFYDKSSVEPIPTFLLEVEVEIDEKDWLEKNKRARLWINANDCADYIKDDDLLSVVRRGIRCLRSEGEYFKRAVKTYCEEHQWRITEIDEEYAELEFEASTGRTHRLFLTLHSSMVEFSATSLTIFNSEEDLPGAFSTTLLQRNAKNKIGFWCIDRAKGRFVYAYIHNAELKLLDSQQFSKIAMGLVSECDEIEELLKRHQLDG